MSDEGTLDPWVEAWIDENPDRATPFADLSPEILELARGDYPTTSPIKLAQVDDEVVDGIPIRVYRGHGNPTGLIVYFHGGGFVIGSIGIMDGVARALAHESGTTVVSVGYRLAPEHPYPAGLDDCEAITRWAIDNVDRFDTTADRVVVAGESAGGNLSAAVALRLRDAGDITLAAQVLLYPGTAGSRVTDSMREFDGLVLSLDSMAMFWGAYSAGRDLDDDPYASPLSAPRLEGLPPALVVLGGADLLRDEGRAYAVRMRDAGVAVDEVCFPGQPHGFLNFGFPAADEAFRQVGEWLRTKLPA